MIYTGGLLFHFFFFRFSKKLLTKMCIRDMCYSKPYEIFDYNTLKDDPLIDPTTIGLKGSPTNIFKSFTPPQKGVGMMLEGADKATCDKLAGILAAKHLI